MRRRFLYLALFFVLLFAGPTAAQQYHFHTYNELDGLPSSTVLDMAQDTEGLLWFGTARGLTRFDGQQWENVGSAGDTPTVRYLFVGRDHEGRMWTVSFGSSQMIQFYDDGRWQDIEFPTTNSHSRHFVYFALGQTQSGHTFLAMANTSGTMAIYEEGRWHEYDFDGRSVGISAMAVVDGRLVIASHAGLYEIDPLDWQLRTTPVTEPVFSVCAVFEGNGMWLVGQDWVGRGTADELEIVARGLDLNLEISVTGTTSLADQSGGLYFGDLAQVYFFHPRFGLESISAENGLKSSGVTRFFLDREGNVWVTGMRGVSKLVNRSMAGFDSRHGLFADEVSAILRCRDGRMILGHLGGLTLMNQQPETISFGEGSSMSMRVTDLAESPDGEVWFATNRLGLGHLRADGSVEFFPLPLAKKSGVYALAFDGNGQLWVGSNDGLYRFTNGKFTHFEFLSKFGNRAILVRRLVVAKDGSLLICSGHFGLFRLHDGELTQYTTDSSDLGRRTYNVYETSSGEILVGTVGGLYTLQDERLQKATAPWPNIERPVYGFLRDDQNDMWFGTDNGVMRWDGRDLVHLTNRDGLMGTETNRDALVQVPDGGVWIGSDRGLTIYHAELDREPLAQPMISITGFEVDGVAYPAGVPLHLSQPARAIDIHFRGVTFFDESNITYRTWLESEKESWPGLDLRSSRKVRYTNVPAGEYRFRVHVKPGTKTLGSEVCSISVVVEPHLTKRWWFRGIVAVLLLALLWVVVSYVLGRRYANQLKAVVQERTFELERSEQDFRAESQRLGATFESISDGVITLNRQDRAVMCNTAAERILGQSQSDILGREVYSVLSVTPLVSLLPGEPTTHVFTRDDGQQTWLEFSVAPITDPDQGDVGTVLAFRDITSRREVENQRVRAQQLESLGVLAGGIAHDFNNLLTIILGNISLVEDAPNVGFEERGQLDKMKAATESARALTEQFLTFARGGDPAIVPTSLTKLVQQNANLAFSGSSASCRLELAPGLWHVNVDRSQIGQVLNNLFLNAGQSMGAGGAVLIKAYNIEGSADDGGQQQWVCLEVHDRGVGIAEGDLERIFDPYYTTKEHGTGLGLAIVHSVIRRHGGTLKVDSELGQGSVFTLMLPATSRALGAEDTASAEQALPPGRILILDDEKDVLDVCGHLLKSMGLSCVATTDGAQTLQMYESAENVGMGFDAVIMDLTVPGGMGGKEAVQRLLEINPRAQVIVTSGYSNDPVMANFRQYGFQGALKKPFDRGDLKRVLSQVLGNEDDG